MTIGKILDEEENDESQNTFQNEEGTLKGQVLDSRIASLHSFQIGRV